MPDSYTMNRNHLALFHAVAQAGGISAGAAAVRVSQPAVSKQIAELEESLGVKLLERLPRGCRLTEAGEILADYAKRWQALEADAAHAIEEYRGLKRGRLSLGASLTIAGYLLPRVLAEFHRRYPEIELRVQTANTRQIQVALLDGTLELGLTEGIAEAPELESEVFFEDELVVVAPAGHPLLQRDAISARELCREPLIVREAGSGTRAVFERALARKGLEFTPLVEFSSPEAIKSAVGCGMGLAIVSRLIVGLELQTKTLGIVPLKDLTIRRPLRRQWLRGRNPSPAGMKFLELLTASTSPAPGRLKASSR
jgi:DNA-binding transcriptional LysR family regulator